MIQGFVQFVDRMRTKSVADLRSIDGDPNRPLVQRPVIGDVGEGEPINLLPSGCVEVLGDHGENVGVRRET